MSDNTWRGHTIRRVGDTEVWLYGDGLVVSENIDRPCGHCGLANTHAGHDGCLGELPGVMNACCGHGHDDPYVQFPDRTELRGEQALAFFGNNGGE